MVDVFPVARWREVLDERVRESVETVLAIEGVADVVVGGSVGRGEPWPFSDIDLIPITSTGHIELGPPLERAKADLARKWAATGWTHILDVGWLAFDEAEVRAFANGDAQSTVALIGDPRWLHGTDKAAGGRGALSNGLGQAFADAAGATRSAVEIRRARFDSWVEIVQRRLTRATDWMAAGHEDDAYAAAQVAGPLAAATLEAWNEREGSMTRFATRFERICATRGRTDLRTSIASISRSDAGLVSSSFGDLPAWLEARIELAFLGRRDVAEEVTVEQNRRDHVLLALGTEGLPSQAEWLRRGVSDAATYIARAGAVAAQVRELRP